MKKTTLLLGLLLTTMTAVAATTLTSEEKGEPLTSEEKQLVESNNDFAFRLFRVARNGQSSMVLSPLSITYALGLLNNGATGRTLQEINQTLGFGDVGADGINNFCHNLMTRSGTLDENTKVLIANNIYVNEARGYHLLPAFVEKALTYYDATPETRNFYDGETRDVINQWASDHTEGLIEEILSEKEFNPSIISYLLNAIYFKGKWSYQFTPEQTKPMAFNGGTSEVQMMDQWAYFLSTGNDLYKSIILPYGNGAYQMTVFLPHEGKTIDDVLTKLNGGDWNADRYGKYWTHLQLPRFESDTDIKLEGIMSALGMPSAFDYFTAHFEDFCDCEDPVFIASMTQTAKIIVDESGTEAAAITKDGVDGGEGGNDKYVEFFANRPFFYVISERESGVIYFMGQYMGDATTSIKDLPQHVSHLSPFIYDLQGRRSGHPTENGQSSMFSRQLRKGIYIKDGKIFIK